MQALLTASAIEPSLASSEILSSSLQLTIGELSKELAMKINGACNPCPHTASIHINHKIKESL